MNPIPFFLCSLFILLTARAEPPKKSGDSPAATLSLSAVTESVLANNPAIQEARAKWEAMKQRVPQAAAWEDLKFSAEARVGRFVMMQPNGMMDQMVSVEQMIPISGKNKSRARIAAAEALVSLEEVRRKELDVLAKTKASFHRLANAYALLDLNRAQENSLSQTVEITRSKFEVGGKSQADVLTAENELTKILDARRDLEQKLSEAETQLGVLMNRDPFKPLGKPSGALPDTAHFSTERLKSLVLTNRPEVRAADAALVAAKEKFGLAKKEWLPDPALSVQAKRYNEASEAVSELAVGISITVPWLNGKKYRAEENEMARGVEAAQKMQDATRTEALGMLRDQLRKVETFHQHVELFRDRLVPTARQTVEANRAGYGTDKTGFLDLIVSQRNQWELESTSLQHLTDYEAAVAELEALVGADLHFFSTHKETSKRKSK